MNADPTSSPPVFSGGPGSPNNTSSPSNQNNGWNHLWLLLLIPIILLMILLILATWYVVRRRRKARQRRSMLRNVTLVVREEEEKRDKEEKRLTRGNSIASKLGRSRSLKEAREKRFEEKVARAVAKEQKEARGGGHQQLPSEDSTEAAVSTVPAKGNSKDDHHEAALAGGAALAGTAVALKRSGSAKHRDREVAERVWKVSSDDEGSSRSAAAEKPKKRKSLSGRSARREAVAAVLPRANEPERDVEAEAASGVPASDSEDLSGNESDKSGSIGHVRPQRKREDSHPLSIIGESGLSEGGPSRDLSRTDLLASPERPRTGDSAAAAAATAAAPIAAESLPSSPKPVYAAGAAAAGSNGVLAPTRRTSIVRTPSQRSRYTTATSASHYTTAESAAADDTASLRTARTGGTVTAVPLDAPTAGAAPSSSAGHDVDPFRSPTSPVSSSHATHEGAASNPFASPTESSAGHSGFAAPAVAAVAAGTASATAAEPKAQAPAAAAPAAPAIAPHDAAHTGLASRISQVIRLKQPTPPTKKSGDLHRVPSSSSSSKPKRSASFSSKKKQQRHAAAAAKSAASPTSPTSPAAESWAYTPRAAEWRNSMSREEATRVSSSSSVPTLRSPSNTATGTGEDVPPVPALPGSKSSEAVAPPADQASASRGLDGRPWIDTPRTPLTPQAQQPPLKRQNSIGVAGSRFKETFDDE